VPPPPTQSRQGGDGGEQRGLGTPPNLTPTLTLPLDGGGDTLEPWQQQLYRTLLTPSRRERERNCLRPHLLEQSHRLMNVVTEISKTSLETHLQGTWARQGHGKGMRNGPRASAHQQHTISQEHRFSNIMGDKHHRLLAMLPHLEQLQVELFAGNGIKRAKRFIHKQY
jgi:hypothetical protein